MNSVWDKIAALLPRRHQYRQKTIGTVCMIYSAHAKVATADDANGIYTYRGVEMLFREMIAALCANVEKKPKDAKDKALKLLRKSSHLYNWRKEYGLHRIYYGDVEIARAFYDGRLHVRADIKDVEGFAKEVINMVDNNIKLKLFDDFIARYSLPPFPESESEYSIGIMRCGFLLNYAYSFRNYKRYIRVSMDDIKYDVFQYYNEGAFTRASINDRECTYGELCATLDTHIARADRTIFNILPLPIADAIEFAIPTGWPRKMPAILPEMIKYNMMKRDIVYLYTCDCIIVLVNKKKFGTISKNGYKIGEKYVSYAEFWQRLDEFTR
jgi:hypothetical protein